jgi:hypothetical protein
MLLDIFDVPALYSQVLHIDAPRNQTCGADIPDDSRVNNQIEDVNSPNHMVDIALGVPLLEDGQVYNDVVHPLYM